MEQIFTLKEPTDNIKSPEDLFKNIKRIKIDYSQENFILICLNTANQVIKSKVLFKGSVRECLISPQVIFKEAILSNSAKIIIGHNHPSGNLAPSYEDKEIYKTLKQGGKLLDINILDNIIFNEKEFYSFNSSEGGLEDE